MTTGSLPRLRRDLAPDERPLLEREAELEALGAVLDAARRGDGRVVVMRLSRCSWNFEVTAVPPARPLRVGA